MKARYCPSFTPKPGRLERYDCEYRRNGTVNLFVFLDARCPWRKAKLTERRAAGDFASYTPLLCN